MPDPQFEGWPTETHPADADLGTRRDSYSRDTSGGGLDSRNQRVRQTITEFSPHLPYSPAAGAPTKDINFAAGHRWTEAEGKAQEGTGPKDLPW